MGLQAIHVKPRKGQSSAFPSIATRTHYKLTVLSCFHSEASGATRQDKDEDELRRIWSVPDTRKALLIGLADKGFGREPLAEMQKVIEAESSDLFDVLAYIAFALEPVTRAKRAAIAKAATATEFTGKQRAFVEFVLAQYVKQGVDELDQEKLSPLLKLKYNNALADAFAELGRPEQVRQVFVGFQKYLYTSAEDRPRL